MLERKHLRSCAKYFALCLSGRQASVHGAAPYPLYGQAAHWRLMATQAQRGVPGT
jgi:hypothetical protein